MTLEPSYTLMRDASRFSQITLVGRFGQAEEDAAGGGTLTRSQVGIAVNMNITKSFEARVGFISQGEDKDQGDCIKSSSLTIL